MGGDLGRELAVHGGSASQGGTAWVAGFMLSPWALCVPYAIIHDLVTRGGAGLVERPLLTFCGFPVIALLGPAILALPVLRWRQRVRLFERGLIHRSLFGTTLIRAEEVSGVEHTIYRRRFSSVSEVVIRRAGTRGHFITGIEDGERLAQVIRAWTRPPAPAVHALASGGWVPPAERT